MTGSGPSSDRIDAFGGLLGGGTSDAGSLPSAEREPAAPRRCGPYTLLDELGRGGMGAVFRARHEPTGAEHAVKLLSPPEGDADRTGRAVRRFQREVELLARIEPHPGVVAIHASGREGAVSWCAMELVHGATLAAEIRRRGRLPPREAAEVVAVLADAVDHVHRHGVVHRDLKPSNIIIEGGVPRIVDFGIAYGDLADRITRTGELLGTPAFMAPEQIARESAESGERQIAAATDVYGLGAILYACLCGTPPFGTLGGMMMLAAIAEQRPPDPRMHEPSIPVDLEAVCLRALEKEPGARYVRAADLAEDLRRSLGGESTDARPLGRVARLVRRILPNHRRRRRRVLAGGALVLVAGLAIVVTTTIATTRTRRAEERRREVARLTAALDRSFDAASGGDLVELDAARSTITALEELGAIEGDPVLTERREIATGLAGLAAGDIETARALPLEDALWRAHREAILSVVLAAGRGDVLAEIVARDRTLVRQPETARRIARAIVERRLPPGAELVEPIVRTLARSDEEQWRTLGDAAQRDRGALRAQVLARRLEVLAAEADEPTPELDVLLKQVVAASRLHGEAAEVTPETLERLFALAARGEPAFGSGELESLGVLVEAAVNVLPPDHPKARELVADLRQRVLLARVKRGARVDRRDAFAALLLLSRLGELPLATDQLHYVAPPIDEIRAHGEAIVRRGTRPFEVAELAALAVIAVRIEQRAREQAAGRAHLPSTRSEALIAHWDLFAALLVREAESGSLPGWAFGDLARLLAGAMQPFGDPSVEPPEVVVRLARRATSDLEVAFGHGDGALEGASLDELRSRLGGVLSRAWERFYRRDVRQRPDVRRVELTRDYLQWLIEVEGKGASPETHAVIVEVLRDRVAPPTSFLEDPDLVPRIPDFLRIAVEMGRRTAEADPATEPTTGCLFGDRSEALASVIDASVPERRLGAIVRARHLLRHGEPEAAHRVLAEARAEAPVGRGLTFLIDLALVDALLRLRLRDEARAILETDPGELFGERADYRKRADRWQRLGDAERAAADRRAAQGR